MTQVLHELAGADQVILGFDIITLERGAPSIHGQTYYDGDLNLDTKPWSDCVTTSLELALRELERIKELSGLEPPHDDVWFAVVAIKSNEWEEMRHKNPRDKDGHFVLYVNPAKDPKP